MKVLKITVDRADATLYFFMEGGMVIPMSYFGFEEVLPLYAEQCKADIEQVGGYLAMTMEDILKEGYTEDEILFQVTLH